MSYRYGADVLFTTLEAWDRNLPGRKRIHLVACGGTALTLLGYKESTKDVDFLVPNEDEYRHLVKFLDQVGYKQVTGIGWKREDENILFDLFCGKTVYVTELLSSPLENKGNKKIKEWSKIYLGVLNPIDLIISKMFRGMDLDIDDCMVLLKNESVDLKKLEQRYKETAQYDVGEDKIMRNYAMLIDRIQKNERNR